MIELICLGHAALDHVYLVERFPSGAVKMRAHRAVEAGGGMAASASVAAARLGGAVAFWGRVGDDSAGATIRAELRREGVEVSGLLECAGGVSSSSAILVDAAGDRIIVNHRGEGLAEAPDFLPLERVRQARAVLVDVRWPQGSVALMARARADGVATVVDLDVGNAEHAGDLLPLADHAVFSQPGLAEFSPDLPVEDGLRRARAMGAGIVGVTLGEHGYRWLDHDGVLRIQTGFAVEVVDTTGAGDAFHGAYALGVARGMSDSACARLASAAAALKCTHPGARAGLPRMDAVVAFLGD